MINRFVPLAMLGLCFMLSSCKYKVAFDTDGMQGLSEELIEKFGAGAWYSELSILNVSDDESAVQVKVTDNPNSLRAKSWLRQAEKWVPLDDVMLQFTDNQPKNHLFQISDDSDQAINLTTLIELIQASNERLNHEGISNYKIHFASIQSAQLVKRSEERILYNISYWGKTNDISYSFVYDLNKRLIAFNH